MQPSALKVVDLFCGVGGVSAGARKGGHQILLMVDAWQEVLRCAENNFGGVSNMSGVDLCKVETGGAPLLLNMDLGSEDSKLALFKALRDLGVSRDEVHIHASPPCTDLSAAKRGRITATKVDDAVRLVQWTLDLIFEYRPRGFSIENVPNLRLMEFLRSYRAQHPQEDIDYHTMECRDYGVPQTRKRLVIGNAAMVQRLRTHAPRHVTVRRAFADAYGHDLLPANYLKNNSYYAPVRKHHKSDESDESDKSEKSDANPKKVGRRSVDEMCFTVTASRAPSWCTEQCDTVRVLNSTELAVLQTFQIDWTLPGAQRDAVRALGNAVPPSVAEAWF